MQKFTAWAINTGDGLLGRYYFERGDLPLSSDGCRTALFRTRKVAREHQRKAFKYYAPEDWKPKVVKVEVIISEAK